jgi:hypothetical protein
VIVIELDIFSGRPNPRWPLSESENVRLTQLIESLAPSPGGRFPSPPGLGYRGFRLHFTTGPPWSAYGRVVQSPERLLADPKQTVERFLVEHLPAEYEELRSSIESELGPA